MISNENLGGLMGAPVVGADDDRIGTVGQVFVDPTTGAPNWVTVHTGWFGRHETFVPLDEASWDREVLRVPYEKDLVKDAPRIDTDEALSPAAESELYGYYEIGGAAAEDSSDQREDTDAATSTGESTRLRKYQMTDAADADQPINAGPDNDEPGSNSKNKGRHRA